MKLSYQLLVISLSFQFIPFVSQAAEPPDPYADTVVSSSGKSYQPAQALGAPDESYLDFLARDAEVTLDMGAGEEGTGNLTLHFKGLNAGATYQVEFLSVDFHLLEKRGATLPLYSSQTTVPYFAGSPYRYLRIRSVEEEEWRLDAVEAAGFITPPEPEPATPAAPSAGGIALPPTEPTARGTIFKLADDGNPTTSFDTTVYIIGADGKRHTFMSETVFRSWFSDFSGLETVNSSSLKTTLGANVTVRPGTHFVKTQSAPQVYAVEPGGVLRWIKDEAIARILFGEGWAARVIDVPDSFFASYRMGSPIEMIQYPTGTVGRWGDKVFYIRGSEVWEAPAKIQIALRFQAGFMVAITDAIFSQYRRGGVLAADPEIQFPF